MDALVWVIGIVLAVIVGGFGLLLLHMVWKGKINLELLVSEKDGSASLSRFQFLIFTFVISMSLFLLVVSNKEFPEISGQILALLGISGGSYVVSKGIQTTKEIEKQKLEYEDE